jgi:glycosyltransferase involved in cell wall biosynthesis
MVGDSDEAFIENVSQLLNDRQRHKAMRQAAREESHKYSWDAVFERIYEQYRGVAGGTIGPTPPAGEARVDSAALNLVAS